MKELILASTSPRRKQLLEQVGLSFRIEASDYEEDMSLDMSVEELAKTLSQGKARAVTKKNPQAVVLAADTFVTFEGQRLGKPHTPEKTREMLSMLSGKSHSLITGFTIIDSEKEISEVVETKVYFRELNDDEIEAYIASGEPLDKAGAYAIQGLGAILVEKIEGDYFNIMGLPLTAVTEALKDFGIFALS